MASNTSQLLRLEVKYVRDGIKSQYPLREHCEICSTNLDLENHHYNTVNILWEKWKKTKGIVIKDADHIMEVRQEFYKDHWNELVVEVVTLCNTHHKKLHALYGQEPTLPTANKQKNWVIKQREKLNVERIK